MNRNLCFYTLPLLILIFGCSSTQINTAPDEMAIKPYTENPRYWQYKNEPILLLGGTDNDNLFQSADLKEQLDLLHESGGNYIRNTMSSRDSGDVWPFYFQEDGIYDLDQWNDEYWLRFENLLKWAEERDIIVQLEVWDRFDFSMHSWQLNPFNPKINKNYSVQESGMAEDYPQHPADDVQPFFHVLEGMPHYQPELAVVRKYLEKFVDKMLSYTLKYGNVLYCMNNETSTPVQWGKHWMKYIHEKAGKKEVFTTDMMGDFFRAESCLPCQEAIQNPEEYTFLDISQINAHNFNQKHWDNLIYIVQQRDQFNLRPLNCVKVYGGANSSWGSGSNEEGVSRFCRIVVGGCAAVRHHRPIFGNGLNNKAIASIKSVRKVESLVKFWEIEANMKLLSGREDNEAYLAASEDEKYVLFFPGEGNVELDLGTNSAGFTGQWINIATGDWGDKFVLDGGGKAEISTPGPGGWFAVILKQVK